MFHGQVEVTTLSVLVGACAAFRSYMRVTALERLDLGARARLWFRPAVISMGRTFPINRAAFSSRIRPRSVFRQAPNIRTGTRR